MDPIPAMICALCGVLTIAYAGPLIWAAVGFDKLFGGRGNDADSTDFSVLGQHGALRKHGASGTDGASGNSGDLPFVSVIIAARNEADEMLSCLGLVIATSYPSDRFELIVVDDESTDETLNLARQFADAHKDEFQITVLSSKNPPATGQKKAALASGIAHSKGDILLMTDADCHVPVSWIGSMVDSFGRYTGFVAGPVQFYAGSSAWSRILALEFMGLSALAAGSIAQGRPFSCSGGSVGIRRSVYDAVGGYTGLEHLSSGDDEMLMHRVNKRPGWEVGYCTDRTAVVWTTSPLSAPELFMQRRRWASKAIHYEALSIRIGFLSGLLFACMLIVLSLAGFYNALYWWILAVMMCVKVLSEMSLLVVASRVFHRSGLLVYHLFVQPVHIFYVCWTGIMGLFGNYEWKGRKLLR